MVGSEDQRLLISSYFILSQRMIFKKSFISLFLNAQKMEEIKGYLLVLAVVFQNVLHALLFILFWRCSASKSQIQRIGKKLIGGLKKYWKLGEMMR